MNIRSRILTMVPVALALLLAACQTPVSKPVVTPVDAPPPVPPVDAPPAVMPFVRPAPPPGAVVGRPVRPLLDAARAANARYEFFAEDGTPRDALPHGVKGSVSIHRAEGGGQDNYTVDADGIVTRHLRSYGADYDAGVWKDAP